jgi:uncharacterized iron-regulated protein
VKRLLLTCLATFGLACASGASAPASAPPPAGAPKPSQAWLTTLDRAHPLVGKIWDVQARAFVERGALVERLAGSRFVLLGERHDNPDHHRLQAQLLQGMLERGRRPSVVFEMLELEQQATVNDYLANLPVSVSGFGPTVRWQDTSWPPFAEYQPIFEVAIPAKLAIACGNIAHETARSLVKQGLAALPSEQAHELWLDQPFPEALAASLTDELRASHCGHLPEQLLEPMALAQHARDAHMASVMLKHGTIDGALLIAGSGHARRDRGVPYYLALAQAQVSVTSVALQEVAHDSVEPGAYGPELAAFDYVWFTPRASDEDPCAAFGKPAR